jgi:hypothetical protein
MSENYRLDNDLKISNENNSSLELKIKEYEQLVLRFANEAQGADSMLKNTLHQRDVLHSQVYQMQQESLTKDHELHCQTQFESRIH